MVEALCRDPFITVNSSSAAVYRSITADPPTMLVDEADTIFGPKADGNEDLRGLLNAGHQRNRPAKRYDAASNRVESIPTQGLRRAGLVLSSFQVKGLWTHPGIVARCRGHQGNPAERRSRRPVRSRATRSRAECAGRWHLGTPPTPR
jgi:hypothetical protein